VIISTYILIGLGVELEEEHSKRNVNIPVIISNTTHILITLGTELEEHSALKGM